MKSKRTAKVIFFGLARSGKSTILRLVERKKITKEMDFHATIDYETVKLLVNDEIEVTIFDCGGVTAFLDRFTGKLAEFLFSDLTTLVFVVDSIEIKDLSRAKYYLDLSMIKIKQYCPQAHVFLFQHKVDLIPQKLRKEVYQTVRKYLLKNISRDIHYYETTIFQNRMDEVMRAVFETTIGAPLKNYHLLSEGRNSVEKVLTKRSAVTIARMIKLTKNPSAIVLPTEFIENLGLEDSKKRWVVMIFKPSTKIIRTIPTKSPKIKQLYIELMEDLTPKFLEELGEVFVRYKINTLYSYWVCSCPEHPYVGYIEPADSSISNDQLMSELSAIPSGSNVQITDLSLGEESFVNILRRTS